MFRNQTLHVAPAAVMSAGTNGPAIAPARARDGVLKTLVTLLLTWQDRARQRYALKEMDPRLLADMGITAADIDHEIRKPFWEA